MFKSFIWLLLLIDMSFGKGKEVSKQEVVCRLENSEITESSGICASRKNPGVFWTHNDSGGKPVIYAFDKEGHDLGTFSIAARAKDWEDIACATVAGQPTLVVGDVGDNIHERESVRLLEFVEPTVPPYAQNATSRKDKKETRHAGEIKPHVINISWPEKSPNCEAVGLCPDGTILLITKVYGHAPCAAYAINPKDQAQEKCVPSKLLDLNIPTVTAMDVSPDGLKCLVLSGGKAYEYTRTARQTWKEALATQPRIIKVPIGQQSEGICYDLDAKSCWLTSETKRKTGELTPVFRHVFAEK